MNEKQNVKLTENTSVKVYYNGDLYKKGATKIYAHCGYDEQWNNLKDIEMRKTSDGFVAELVIESGNTFNICFKNENGEWDNNNQQNYIYKLNKQAAPLSFEKNAETYSNKLDEITRLCKINRLTQEIKSIKF